MKPLNKATKFFFNGRLFNCPNNIYYPSEDSHFLAENVFPKEKSHCIDVGCGSGIQSLNLLFKKAGMVDAIDLEPDALTAAKKNCELAGFGKKIRTHKSDLFKNYEGNADLIVFNPPYVPSEQGEGKKYPALDGGKKGREILDRFLEQFPEHLKENGKCIFLQTDINGFSETRIKLEKLGFKFSFLAKKRGFFEELAVCCADRKKLQ
jgi:release factor glutamine methyltransferase